MWVCLCALHAVKLMRVYVRYHSGHAAQISLILIQFWVLLNTSKLIPVKTANYIFLSLWRLSSVTVPLDDSVDRIIQIILFSFILLLHSLRNRDVNIDSILSRDSILSLEFIADTSFPTKWDFVYSFHDSLTFWGSQGFKGLLGLCISLCGL